MISKSVLITYPSGLHARPLSKFIGLVKKYKSDITLLTPKGEVKCNSIVNLLAAAIKQGTTVEVRADGVDQAEALAEIVHFLENMHE
ncbi:MAG: HPr family phosphocarrier protein [Deltaproteobacteria bacterium]|jgi:phosphocarrier protein|nr:HPr family phosphocarrier protein [Deltaproteobacteria bacterium]